MTMRKLISGLGLTALVLVTGCGRTTSSYRAAYCQPPAVVGYAPASAPCCNGGVPTHGGVPAATMAPGATNVPPPPPPNIYGR